MYFLLCLPALLALPALVFACFRLCSLLTRISKTSFAMVNRPMRRVSPIPHRRLQLLIYQAQCRFLYPTNIPYKKRSFYHNNHHHHNTTPIWLHLTSLTTTTIEKTPTTRLSNKSSRKKMNNVQSSLDTLAWIDLN